MVRQSRVLLAPALALCAACGGKTQSAAMPAVDSNPPAPVATPAAAASTPTMSLPAAPTAAGASRVGTAGRASAPGASPAKPTTPAMKNADSSSAPGYDRAIKPKFKIDEKTGKIEVIKRP